MSIDTLEMLTQALESHKNDLPANHPCSERAGPHHRVYSTSDSNQLFNAVNVHFGNFEIAFAKLSSFSVLQKVLRDRKSHLDRSQGDDGVHCRVLHSQ